MDLILIFTTLIISIMLGAMTIPNIVFISKKKKLFDTFNSRKVHTKNISRLGGISFLPTIFVSFFLVLGIGGVLIENYEPFALDRSIYSNFLLFVSGSILLFVIGVADDLVGIGFKIKFSFQIPCALLLSIGGLYIDNFGGLFSTYEIHPVVGVSLTTLAIVLIVNAYNLIDGIDGLCSGLIGCVALFITIWSAVNGLVIYAMLGAALLGTVLVFLYFNLLGRRLKIFMGDAGSLLLGYVVCFLIFSFIDLNGQVEYQVKNPIIIALSLMFVPIFDTIRVFAERILTGKSPFHPDKRHIHHHIIALGFSHIKSTLIIISFTVILTVGNLFFNFLNPNILFVVNILIGIVFLLVLPKMLLARKAQEAYPKRHKERRHIIMKLEENIPV